MLSGAAGSAAGLPGGSPHADQGVTQASHAVSGAGRSVAQSGLRAGLLPLPNITRVTPFPRASRSIAQARMSTLRPMREGRHIVCGRPNAVRYRPPAAGSLQPVVCNP
ncbi:hypothetical protein P3T21_003375 [Paraburkholderia sp. GAS334]